MATNSLTETTLNINTMTSREIAELTGKSHAHVLRDIDNTIKALEPELVSGFKSSTYISGDPPREYRQFIMDRDSTYCLVAGYDANARMRIIKRWQELEAKKPAELTREQILVMALESERERLRLAQELEAAKPMIEFHEEVSQAKDEYLIAEACNILFNGAVTEKELRNWMKVNNWIDKRTNVRKATKWAVDRGYMRTRLDKLNGRFFPAPVVTSHGLVHLRHLKRENELFVTTIPQVRRMKAPEYRV